VSLANSLPQSASPIPALLIYISPFVTVLISVIWATGVTKLQRWLRRRSLDANLQMVIRLRDQILADGGSSVVSKKQAQANVERIRTLLMELILEDTRHTSTIADLIPATIPLGPQEAEDANADHLEGHRPMHNS
jgi:hypothetical protein